MDAAVTEDGEVVAEVDFGDGDAGEKIRFLRPVERGRQGREDRVVLVRVVSELRDRLRDQDVEPVERFGLVRIDVVVGFREDGACGEADRGAEHIGGGAFGVQLLGCWGGGDGGGASVG